MCSTKIYLSTCTCLFLTPPTFLHCHSHPHTHYSSVRDFLADWHCPSDRPPAYHPLPAQRGVLGPVGRHGVLPRQVLQRGQPEHLCVSLLPAGALRGSGGEVDGRLLFSHRRRHSIRELCFVSLVAPWSQVRISLVAREHLNLIYLS